MEQRTPACDGLLLAYHDVGCVGADTLILLHSLGADSAMWQQVADTLQNEFRIIIPDARGHGNSGPAMTRSVDEWVSDLHSVVQQAQVERAVVVGVSLGGIQAAAFAAAQSHLVSGLVLADSFAELEAEDQNQKIQHFLDLTSMRSMSDVADVYLEETFVRPYSSGAIHVREALAAMDRDSLMSAVNVCFGVHIRDRLRHITAPTLVLWGDHDDKAPRRLSEQIRDDIQSARLIELRDSGHLSNIDAPNQFAGAIMRFKSTP